MTTDSLLFVAARKVRSGTDPGGDTAVRWSAHTLRHRFGTRAYAGTHDLLAVQQLLGHADPATTKRYTQLADETLTAAVRSV